MVTPINNDDWNLFSRTLLEKLGVQTDTVRMGSVRAEGVSGDGYVTVTWDGIAKLPEAEFREMFNGFKVRRDEG